MTVQTTLLFTGDSITDAGRRTDPDGRLGGNLGDGYVRRIAEIAARHEKPVQVVNTGVGGDRTIDLLARWEVDVMQIKPDILSVMIGVNDMWRRFDSGLSTSAAEFRATYSVMLDRALSALTLRRLVLLEPFLVPVTSEQHTWHTDDLDAKIQVVRDLAVHYDATLIPLNDLFAAEARATGPASVIEDGVHPSAGGHELIAREWWRVMESAV
ncbi:SGNH/GDSL hydrolase family protein [Subtercola boreus]|uniref:SGNH hydrolase-type esterase domain-containing protein n=1 Tax=Subtercola boreus TaxID=120213 RepID=A0A3E0WAC2_9MICO|nr:SGNH/GDSL hydrolase family protein [Subtercola boreus]RFA20566.1 hypothetical protein B7R24_09030 [Subtercola boreus]RFA20681.1 hypothetical protein B7R23_08965 [Subtercola boreus]RFA26891.1 hypothetical protein B7R25_09095 [Subtercola boreus]